MTATLFWIGYCVAALGMTLVVAGVLAYVIHRKWYRPNAFATPQEFVFIAVLVGVVWPVGIVIFPLWCLFAWATDRLKLPEWQSGT